MDQEKRLKLKSAIRVALMVRPQILETHVDRLDLIADAVVRVFEDEIGNIRYFSSQYNMSAIELTQSKESYEQAVKEKLAKDIMYSMLQKGMFVVNEEKQIQGKTITLSINVIK